MSTPTEIRAQAIALHAMGYSCRRIEKQLRTVFPGADIPRYCTISRWVRRRPTGWLSVLQWQDAYSRAGDILFERIE